MTELCVFHIVIELLDMHYRYRCEPCDALLPVLLMLIILLSQVWCIVC